MRSSVTTSTASTARSMAAVLRVVFLESSQPDGWIQRNRDGSRAQHAEQALDKLWTGRQHECDAITRPHTASHQIRSDRQRALPHASHRDFLVLLLPVHEEQALLTLRRGGEHLGQSRMLRTNRGRASHGCCSMRRTTKSARSPTVRRSSASSSSRMTS